MKKKVCNLLIAKRYKLQTKLKKVFPSVGVVILKLKKFIANSPLEQNSVVFT